MYLHDYQNQCLFIQLPMKQINIKRQYVGIVQLKNVQLKIK